MGTNTFYLKRFPTGITKKKFIAFVFTSAFRILAVRACTYGLSLYLLASVKFFSITLQFIFAKKSSTYCFLPEGR